MKAVFARESIQVWLQRLLEEEVDVWHAEYEAWRTRPLADLEPVYVWVDGIYVKAGLEREKAAMLVGTFYAIHSR